jgi:drug/metabolite transporter (DMT)-like permease
VLTLVSFTGVVLIVQPDFIFGKKEAEAAPEFIYILLMMVVAFGHAMNMHYVHGLSKFVSPFVNINFSHCGNLVVSTLMCNINPQRVDSEELTVGLGVVVLGVVITVLICQYGMFLANTLKPPSLVMPFAYMNVLVGFLADVYFFDTHFTPLIITGMLLTSTGLLSGYLLSKTNPKVEMETTSGQQAVSN